ncbi:M4 family metallopeptidase [Massilia sp. B-10]|nr:M4 family metallopeptidase [Massilia sp. B-10]
MSHGVTAATSNLVYRAESGGLNESNSDIGGEMVEAYAQRHGTGSVVPNTGNDWVTGQEISKNGDPLRWLYKPSKDGRSPDAWSTKIKRLDVHLSSGPNNRMFYFLSQGSNASSSSEKYSKYLTRAPLAMTGIGSDKAFRIWFKALSTKFTSATNYADADQGAGRGAGTVRHRQPRGDRRAARVCGHQRGERRRRVSQARSNSMIQLVSQAAPPSAEKACSQRGLSGSTCHRKRTRIGTPLNTSSA